MRNWVLVVLLLAFVACGKGGGVSGPSEVGAAAAAEDWTQPSGDVLDYYGLGMATTWAHADGSLDKPGSIAFMDLGDRIALCSRASCRDPHIQWLRADDEYLYFVLDAKGAGGDWYSGRNGSETGAPWSHRFYRVGELVSNFGDGTAGDLGYELVQDCATGKSHPMRERDGITWAGVVDWGGTIGKRHSIRLDRFVDSPLGTGRETSWLVRGAGMVRWALNDPELNVAASRNVVVKAESLGYSRADLPGKVCGW